jgi:hypothetical protein
MGNQSSERATLIYADRFRAGTFLITWSVRVKSHRTSTAQQQSKSFASKWCPTQKKNISSAERTQFDCRETMTIIGIFRSIIESSLLCPLQTCPTSLWRPGWPCADPFRPSASRPPPYHASDPISQLAPPAYLSCASPPPARVL